MRPHWVGLLFLIGCSAQYGVPTQNFSKEIVPIKPDVLTIPSTDLDPIDPSKNYTVKPGDTLFAIAFRFGQDPDLLKRRNQLPNELIFPGQILILKGDVPAEPSQKVALPPKIDSIAESKKKQSPRSSKSTAKSESKIIEKKPLLKSKSIPKKAKLTPSFKGWQWPVNGPVIESYSTKTKYSRSIKLGGKAGAPVMAAAAGRVVYAGDGLIGFGNLIILSHPNKYLSAYGHNQSLAVEVGDAVDGGTVIANMGSTGTDSVKLHFEIRKQGIPVNPMKLLPERS